MVKMPTDESIKKALRKHVLVSHAVTLAPEEYIKKSAKDFLLSYVLQRQKIITVNTDPKNLEAAMLTSSINRPDDVAMLLHGCVSSTSGLKLVQDMDEDSTKLITDEEKAWKKLTEDLHNCSLENIIDMTKNSQGTKRIEMFSEDTSQSTDIKAFIMANIRGLSKAKCVGDFIRVTKPAEIDYTKLDLNASDNLEVISTFLDDIILFEAGFVDYLDISLSLFSKEVYDILLKMDTWASLAVELAGRSKQNDIQLEVVDDPWKALFNNL